MSATQTTLIGAIEKLGQDIGVSVDTLQKQVDAMVDNRLQGLTTPVQRFATSDPREEVLIRFTVGSGQWSENRKYNVLRMKMFKPDGQPDGSHDGVWQPVVGGPEELAEVPPRPREPYDEPKGPVPETAPRAQTKAVWRFGESEEDSVVAVGPAMLHLVGLSDESQIFLVSVCGIITGGTGRYEGARGVKTALGSTFVPPGVKLFEVPPDQKFGAVTVETFRIVRAGFLG
jgi:hypothetical protein